MQESKPSYHHNNLRNALIEHGIKIVSAEGVENLSLRKVAADCGVSHAAPYNHFGNKEEFLAAMQEYITEQFSDVLERTVLMHGSDDKMLEYLGISYFSFFRHHPTYFSFLYAQGDYAINLSPAEGEKEFKPFEIYKRAACEFLGKTSCPPAKYDDVILAMWAYVHGLTAFATAKNIKYHDKWEDRIKELLDAFDCSLLWHAGGAI